MAWRNLQEAIEHAGLRDRVDVAFEPFVLNPSIPAAGMSVDEYIQRVYGRAADDPQRQRQREHLQRMGLDCSPPIRFVDSGSRLIYPTMPFHRIMERARQVRGNQVALGFQESCWKRYFEGNESLTDAVLAREAVSAGIFEDEEAGLAFLRSGELREETARKEYALKREYRCTGVPFVVGKADGRVVGTLSGAQPPEVYEQLLRRMAERETEKQCDVCGAPAEKRCGGCKSRRFCSVECQKRDWGTHRANCGKKGAACDENGVCEL